MIDRPGRGICRTDDRCDLSSADRSGLRSGGPRGSHVADLPDQHLGHDNRGDRPTEVLLMAAYGERGVLHRPKKRVMRWRNGALSGSDLANEPGLGSSRTYQPGEMPMPSKPKPGLTRMHQEMNSEAASSGSPLRAAVPPKRGESRTEGSDEPNHARSG